MTDTEPSEENSQRPLTITKKHLLLVEGSDDWHFFTALLRHLEIDEVQIIRCGSRDEIRARISALRVAPTFESVERIGVVRDADENATGAFDSVRGALSAASLPIPQSEMDIVTATQPPAVSVFIMPGNRQPGMLETLLCQSFANPVIDGCIDRFLDCAPGENGEWL
ncbi:MAG: hypothetical protein OXH38_12400, partial [Chloroflexi bacterium]|nr:hypothetical protein [Chloroflexota bacterium]